jgi:hypothetical protein
LTGLPDVRRRDGLEILVCPLYLSGFDFRLSSRRRGCRPMPSDQLYEERESGVKFGFHE